MLPAPAPEQEPLAAGQPSCPHPLLLAPDGPPVGCLNPAAPVVVQERLGGWVRISLEGWLPEETALQMSAPKGEAALVGTAVVAAGAPVAGAVARLLGRPEELDRDLATLRARHEGSRSRLESRQAELSKALERVLFSSDNLLEVQQNRRRLRGEIEALERERAALRQESFRDAQALIERHELRRAATDATGFFALEKLEPGAYRLLVGSEPAGTGPAWYVPVSVVAGERRQLTLRTGAGHTDPFSSFD